MNYCHLDSLYSDRGVSRYSGDYPCLCVLYGLLNVLNSDKLSHFILGALPLRSREEFSFICDEQQNLGDFKESVFPTQVQPKAFQTFSLPSNFYEGWDQLTCKLPTKIKRGSIIFAFLIRFIQGPGSPPPNNF